MTAPALQTTRRCPYAPPDEHTRIRDSDSGISQVTLPSGQVAWAMGRLEHIRAMLTDPRFSSDRRHPNFPRFTREQPAFDLMRPSLIQLDPPDHGPARKAVVGEFTVRRMAGLRPRIQQIVGEHIDALLAGPRPTDLVQALSLPVPSLVICEQLGVPYGDHEFFQRNSSALLSRTTTPEGRRQAVTNLRDYLRELIAAKTADPADDLLGRQLAQGSDPEDVLSLAFLLLIAGHETTANMISLGVVTLLERPGELAALREDPARTLPAIEELLRVYTIAEFANSRVAIEDVEIGGVTIRAGDPVLALSNAANHDPSAFDEAEEIKLDRGARNHVAFGFGIHQCLGQNLARMELQIVFDTLFRRIPTLRLATPADALPYKNDAFVYGIHELPVTWEDPA
ncbi:cytochrome P450 [Actinoplanes philippinensis]|uniref:Cytochrome P450 n=1 Tax=Actinoplanes philippinensis TaxID=35752 RepID=A0A1I2I4E4_9ACTN|nr:cytochrome P450 [Actinoplanes philippinensis]GIE78633.1 cytochrome P450 [Actinoplanes philippinensis]SFF37215.1 Cytochrome P450 [Actinoplanes philippinensis]